jgi:subtilisin family serine protease
VSGAPYVGVAPEAELLLVAFGEPGGEVVDPQAWLTTSVCDGARFVFEEAQRLGMPAVVNVSLGTHAGPHDGASLADACLDELVGPGRIIVAAAGNEGEGGLHATRSERVFVHAAADASATPLRLGFRAASYDGYTEASAELWTDAGGVLQARVGVRGESGTEVTTELAGPDSAVDGVMLESDGVQLGPIAVQPDESPIGARALAFLILDLDGDEAELGAEWFLEVSSSAHFDGFSEVAGGGGFVPLATSPRVRVDSAMTVGYPAVATSVIAVGSYTSRATWTTSTGERYEALDTFSGERVVEGALSSFSSRGPTRDPGRTGLKPEITAPGEMIAAALGTARRVSADANVIVKDPPGGFMVGSGTSQSAPMVTGIVALMLERDPELTPEQVRELLRETALPSADGSAPSDAWGYGKADAFAAVLATREIGHGQAVDRDEGGCAIVRMVPGAPRWPARAVSSLIVGGLVLLVARRHLRREPPDARRRGRC